MPERNRFEKGDHIVVKDKLSGHQLAEGEAMHTRGYFGEAQFQVMVNDWARTYNLNFVTVEKA